MGWSIFDSWDEDEDAARDGEMGRRWDGDDSRGWERRRWGMGISGTI